MEVLKTINGIGYLEERKHDPFADSYVALKSKEGNLFSDYLVRQLPHLKKHPKRKMWGREQQISSSVINYLKTKPVSTTLEIGGGLGWFSNEVAKALACQSYVLASSVKELEQGRRCFESNNLHYLYGLDFSLLEDNFFDVIVFNSSFHLIENYAEALEVLKKKLKPNGEIHVFGSEFFKNKSDADYGKHSAQQYFLKMEYPELSKNHFFHVLPQVPVKTIHYKPTIGKRFVGQGNRYYWLELKA